MEATLSRTEIITDLSTGVDLFERAAHIVWRSTLWRRWLGTKQYHAMEDAALALGTSRRRVQSLLRGEIVRVLRDEHDRLLNHWLADMDRAAGELRARAAEMEREADAERLASMQLTLDLEPPKCSPRSAAGSFFGAGGVR